VHPNDYCRSRTAYSGRKGLAIKVGELIKKVHLYGDQKIKVNDHSTAQTITTKDRYCFELDSDEVQRILKLKVNSFEVRDTGLTVWAE